MTHAMIWRDIAKEAIACGYADGIRKAWQETSLSSEAANIKNFVQKRGLIYTIEVLDKPMRIDRIQKMLKHLPMGHVWVHIPGWKYDNQNLLIFASNSDELLATIKFLW